MGYQVTAPLVIVPDETGAQRYFYKDAVLPSGLDRDRVKQLAKEGMLEQVEVAADSDAGKPAKVDDILAEVGDDKEKAAAALEAENASDKPRTSLVSKLQAVIDAE